jgi:hypothetical protein
MVYGSILLSPIGVERRASLLMDLKEQGAKKRVVAALDLQPHWICILVVVVVVPLHTAQKYEGYA